MTTAPLAFTLLVACGGTPQVKVLVTDVWNAPIEGATVIREGLTEHFVTTADGSAMVPVEAGTLHVKAGRDGYIPELASLVVAEEQEDFPPLRIKLYPEPESPGFYAVGNKGYLPLNAQPIEAMGSEMTNYHGVRGSPTAVVPVRDGGMTFVFTTALSKEEIRRQDLTLSSLKYLDEAEVVGLFGPTAVDIDLWVADRDMRYDVDGLQSRDDYLITIQPALETGVYAFHGQDILDPRSARSLDKLPEELRVAWMFKAN